MLNLLETRTNGYSILLEALDDGKQSGALEILRPAPAAAATNDMIRQIGRSHFRNISCHFSNWIHKIFRLPQSQPLLFHTFDVEFSAIRFREFLTEKFEITVNDEKDEGQVQLDSITVIRICQHTDITMLQNDGCIWIDQIYWDELLPAGQEKLKESKLRYQNVLVRVRDLVQILSSETGIKEEKFYKEICDDVLELLFMNKEPDILSGNIPDPSGKYISRMLMTRNRLSIDALSIGKTQSLPDIVMVIRSSSMKLNSFSIEKHIGKENCETISQIRTTGKRTCKLIWCTSLDDYEQIFELHTNDEIPLHLLKFCDAENEEEWELQWIKSTGSTRALQPFVLNRQRKLAEGELPCFNDTPTIICGSQGMGKTSLLSQHASQIISDTTTKLQLFGNKKPVIPLVSRV